MIYFASDFHLGMPNYAESLEREKEIVRFLEKASEDATEIYLLGDIFDFWFEYKHAVPKGFVRILGCIAKITDAGIPVTIFKGNHDMWMFGYLEQECGVQIVSNELEMERNGKRFYLHHGDGLGPGDKGYKIIKKIFRSGVNQWLFERLHPNFGIWLAGRLSKRSRLAQKDNYEEYLGDDKEFLTLFCKEFLKEKHVDYFIFGHRHLPLDIKVGENSCYVNLGEWLHHRSYAKFNGKDLELLSWK